MDIAKKTVVSLKYRVSDPDGNPIDEGGEPLVYLHGGFGGIFPRIEEALEGKPVGAQLELKLQPDEAFGEYDASLVTIEPLSAFPENVEAGMQFERVGEGQDEERLYTITEISEDKVVVDGNHPLAGVPLVFECVVTDVRAASEEELAHGHVHGAHAHQH
ncbi:MAG TPA: peptidylprolyl isomerase [Rhodocyclaceae bacterium]|nr:MAG: peptidylprolyl isomerase [Betaproteobacteria bacterium CG2_30_68_42]PIX76354.1 MAG: peptidylprolyl isomerase [Rhodocyclales bacterium CG_4_10_14_3_um_filter_68_10]HCX33042.1 peptidylprolyl isomerase [Rhodocyclaceae bacterium]